MAEAHYLKLAEAYLKEAWYDLKVADILIAHIKPGLEESVKRGEADDEVFYMGRRTLYFLQQATEKLAKAFILGYPKFLLENMRKIVKWYSGVNLPVPKFREAIEKILEISDELEPKKIGHKPHEAIVKVLREYRDSLTTYREPIMNSYNQLSEVYEKFFNTLSDEHPEERDRIEELKKVFLNELYSSFVKQFKVLYIEYPSTEKEGGEKNKPPCLDTIEKFRQSRSEVERLSREPLEKFRESREKLTPYKGLLSSLIEKAKLKTKIRNRSSISYACCMVKKEKRPSLISFPLLYTYQLSELSSCHALHSMNLAAVTPTSKETGKRC